MSDRSLHASNATKWKSFEELAHGQQETGEFAPGTTAEPLFDSSVSRRGFMALVSASMALTAAACRRPETKLVPSVKSLQNATPGLPVEYASVYSNRNVAYGAVIKTREGRPIKVKGNNLHPSNNGRTSSEMQASLLSLYDPDRIRRPKMNGAYTTFDSAVSKVAQEIQAAGASNKKIALFVDEHCSPTFANLLSAFAASLPNAMVVSMPAITSDNVALANRAMLNLDGEIVPDLSKATTIVGVDADFLGADKLSLHHTIRFAERRSPTADSPVMSHLTVAEAQYSLTGMNADLRHRMHPSELETLLAVIEQAVCGASSIGASQASSASKQVQDAGKNASARLMSARDGGVVLVGRNLSARAHAIALNINNSLGSVGTGKIIDAGNVLPDSGVKSVAIDQARVAMESGSVHVAIFCDVNPEYSASRSFRKALAKVPVRVAVNLFEDETSTISSVSIPAAHWLESWGTAQSFNGTVSIQQPMIAPLCDGVPSLADTLMAIGKKVDPAFITGVETYADYVKSWVQTSALAGRADGLSWTKALQDGVISSGNTQSVSTSFSASLASTLPGSSVKPGMTVLSVPSLALYDGKLANNGWLQELPDPVTKVTWDNVALISPGTAIALGLASSKEPKSIIAANDRVLTVSTSEGAIDLPVVVQPGLADDIVVTQVGYGRTSVGTVGQGVGSNAFLLGSAQYSPATVKVAEGHHKVATTQGHHTLTDGQGDRPVAKMLTVGDLAALNQHGGEKHSLDGHYNSAGKDGLFNKPLSITSDYEYKGHRWGMVIDMSSCTGCSSCIIACQSENNIPVVGKAQVALGREMHWIRLDRYYTGDMDSPGAIVEPMLCQHCENAPCENVCPVAATTHSPEGLNEMTYNRCVGTRYCLNNCPYKVRRFNFLNYSDERKPLDLAFNPEVSGRMRGVMEKCTFCVQRLHEAKWHARDNGRSRVHDGEAITACQEACPAGAIVFGDVNDSNSKVSIARQNQRGFRVLADINTRPSITYLAKVVNAPASTDHGSEAHH